MTAALRDAAERVIAAVRAGGAEVLVTVERRSFVELRVEAPGRQMLQASSASSARFRVRYGDHESHHHTSDLRPTALYELAVRATELTRAMSNAAHRPAAASAAMVGTDAAAQLDLVDSQRDAITNGLRHELCRRALSGVWEVAARPRAAEVTYGDSRAERVHARSDGFLTSHAETEFRLGLALQLDDGGVCVNESVATRARHLSSLPEPERIGRDAAALALARRGAINAPSARCPAVLAPRAARVVISQLAHACEADRVASNRSPFAGRRHEQVAAAELTLVDDPLVPQGLGSRLFDAEGVPSRRRALIRDGRFAEALPGAPSNLLVQAGSTSVDALVARADGGVYVTCLAPAAADHASGAVRFYARGFAIAGGRRADPLRRFVVAASHRTLWHTLFGVGDDTDSYETIRAPALAFERLDVRPA